MACPTCSGDGTHPRSAVTPNATPGQREDIYVFLRKIHGVEHVELRVYPRSARPREDSQPGTEGIVVPVDALADLLRVLEETQERLVQGRAGETLPAKVTTIQGGELASHDTAAPRRLSANRRGRRVPVRVPVECRFFGADDTWKIAGETRDVSAGGAQVWLAERIPVLSRVEVFMHIAGLNFKGWAEVVGIGVHATQGRYRHGLRWLDLDDDAKAALSKVTRAT